VYASVNLYGSKEIAKVAEGEELQFFGVNRKRTAYRVKTASGQKGWIDVYAFPTDMLPVKIGVFNFEDNNQFTERGEAQRAASKAEKLESLTVGTQITAKEQISLRDNNFEVVKGKVEYTYLHIEVGETFTVAGKPVEHTFKNGVVIACIPVTYKGTKYFVQYEGLEYGTDLFK
jgi:hypothetical protein